MNFDDLVLNFHGLVLIFSGLLLNSSKSVISKISSEYLMLNFDDLELGLHGLVLIFWFSVEFIESLGSQSFLGIFSVDFRRFSVEF